MRVSATILSFVAATFFALSPAFAQGHSSSAKPASSGKPVTTTTHSTGKPTSTGKPVATTTHTTGKPTTTGKPVTTTTQTKGKPATTGKPVTTTTQTKGKPATTGNAAKSTTGKPTSTATTTASSSGSTSKHTGSTSTSTTTTASGSPTTPLNPIAAKIASKPNLSTKINGMLPIDPVTGVKMTLDAASMGFKNQGQFIAALHVSQNLGIPFTELKSHMVTVTPGVAGQPATATQTGSLGQAIQASKKTANVTTEVERAETQASADLQSASSTSTITTSGSTQTKKKNTTPPPTTTTGRGGR